MKWIIFLLLIGTSVYSYAQNEELTVKKTDDFTITGNGSSKQWNNAEWINVPQYPAEEGYTTQVKILYSETGLYFFVACEDEKITASKTGYMEDLWVEDVFEIFLWTDEDYPLYFEYEISPLNNELVLLVPNFDGDFLGWIPWHYDSDRKIKHLTNTKGGKKESGAEITSWTAEIFIPFELLKPLRNSPPTSGMRWRMNLYRMDYDSGERKRWEWRPVESTFHEIDKFGTIRFE